MAVRRTYLPLDLDDLRALHDRGEVTAAALEGACAVTAAVARELPDDDEEEREYDALRECAAVAAERAGARRRVIAAADLAPAGVADVPDGYAFVRVTSPVRLGQLVSFHVDETTAHEDEDLLWYDVSELAEVLRLVEQD
ncbi:DUF6912 family protein [Arsenicicoccus dermatophilus]|uniref:DUF6912 family protein n=1 Tax=Arsenicicoccus dermatophilus TaxID=1076331 RepID=UPI003916F4FF